MAYALWRSVVIATNLTYALPMIDHDRLFKELLTTLPVYPIVLFSYDTPVREEPSAHQVAFPDLTVLNFTYRVIQLNRLNWHDFARRPNPVASALMAKMGTRRFDSVASAGAVFTLQLH